MTNLSNILIVFLIFISVLTLIFIYLDIFLDTLIFCLSTTKYVLSISGQPECLYILIIFLILYFMLVLFINRKNNKVLHSVFLILLFFIISICLLLIDNVNLWFILFEIQSVLIYDIINI
jgi:hypothetical protein